MLMEYADRGSLEEAIEAKRFQRRSDKSQLDMVRPLVFLRSCCRSARSACVTRPPVVACLPAQKPTPDTACLITSDIESEDLGDWYILVLPLPFRL